MNRSMVWLLLPTALLVLIVGGRPASVRAQSQYDVIEATIAQLQSDMARGAVTSAQLVDIYLARIERYRSLLNPVISINPEARRDAEKLDAERASGLVRSPLHGIPIALKDNINTVNMPTTGGALAFAGYTPPYKATLVTMLERAGAVIMAKTVLTELANWVTNGMPANYSAVGLWGQNPYDPRPDPRPPNNDGRPVLGTGGSSSGIGTAANLWVANVGTETSGSILSPASSTMLVGIKPTVGLISGWGVIPITADQDIAGPMARTVTDAAMLLSGMRSPVPDPNDPATSVCPPNIDYRSHLRLAGLSGARIGIPRAFYYDPITLPGQTTPTGGRNAAQLAALNEAIGIMQQQGATIVDPANIPSVIDGTPSNNLLLFGTCTGTRAADATANCSTVLKYGFKRDFNAYLASLGPTAPVKSLTELRAFNVANAARNAIRYGQTLLDNSDQVDLVADEGRYNADRARDIYLARTHGIDEVLAVNRLDAIIFGSNTGANISARPGLPSITVPFAMLPNAGTFPDGFNPLPGPFGITFAGTTCSEGRLIELAFAFEQATRRRVPPASAP
jgi:amidase